VTRDELKLKLERNIELYSWFKILTKRVYLPLIGVHLVNMGQVTVEQLALIASITVVMQVILQMPTGYIADRWGNKVAIITGSILMLLSPLPYIIIPNFTGGLIASLLNFGGYTFLSGAIESFIHDTLVVLEREKEYSKILGRAQSYGLVGNMILIAIVPATYAINIYLPFVIGFVAQLVMLGIALNFTFLPITHDFVMRNPFEAIKKIVNIQNIALFLFIGVMSGALGQAQQFRELVFQYIGIPVEYFGILLAIGSLLGAIMGWYIHLFDKLTKSEFYLFDLFFITACFFMIGISKEPILVVFGFSLLSAYSRIRLIVVQAKLLNNLKHRYKATLISGLSLFTSLGDVLAVTVLAGLISRYNYSLGYLYFCFEVIIVGLLLLRVVNYFLDKAKLIS
jgi:MFS family permease